MSHSSWWSRRGGPVRDRLRQDDHGRRQCLTVTTNAVICWHIAYLGLAVVELRRADRNVDAEVLAHISPARSSAVNYYGSITVDYDRELAQLDEHGHRPLRTAGDATGPGVRSTRNHGGAEHVSCFRRNHGETI
ncbi:Tn3 family transposase [Streptomyces microflavus]|uniref:Tn3 family transposase n=1 Tax=Streptomyces microflavus TaxID=1919 RepID=UPI0037FBC510